MSVRRFLLRFLLPIALAIATHAGAQAAGATLPCTYFVGSTGSDRNDGTSIATPFATLEKAQSAARRSSSKVVCLRAGTYNQTAPLMLTAADSGETWQYYPPDGINSAVLDGGKAADLFSINGAANVTINGLKMQNVYDYAINSSGALSTNITIENCDIGFNQRTSFAGGFNPMVGLGNVINARILHNYVHDTASQGIALYAWNAGDTVDGSIVSGNVVLRAVQQKSDGGGIYLDMRYSNVNGGHVTISNNYVKDYGAPGISSARGIYLDDDSSNVTVTGNVIGPPHPATTPHVEAIMFNGGSGNVFSNNIVDLGKGHAAVSVSGPGGTGGTLAYKNPIGPNVIENNIVIANYSGAPSVRSWDVSGHVYGQNPATNSRWLTISNNLYYNYGGGAADSHGNMIGDANPIFANPQISGWHYSVASGSPVFRSALKFKPIVGGWGPPGFVIPQSGVAPSSPH